VVVVITLGAPGFVEYAGGVSFRPEIPDEDAACDGVFSSGIASYPSTNERSLSECDYYVCQLRAAWLCGALPATVLHDEARVHRLRS